MENKDNKMEKGRMPFTMKNYVMMLAGLLVIVLGFVLMSGGGEHTVTEFDQLTFARSKTANGIAHQLPFLTLLQLIGDAVFLATQNIGE